jgi:hypothetical protein
VTDRLIEPPATRDDLTLRIRLTDSPISRAGYWWATLVGFAWGFLWSTGPIVRRDGLIVFTGMPKWTYGRGGSCVGGCYLTGSNTRKRVLEHETVHKAQWQRYGMLFPLLYFMAGRNPLKNRFEIEAGLEAGGYLPTPRRTRR